MTEKSLAAVAVDVTTTELREFDLPDIEPDAGLLEIEAAGVCGSDWHIYQRKGPARIQGHENVGRIARIGPIAARNWKLKEGDRIALEEYIPCGQCELCRAGDFRLCSDTERRGNEGGVLRYGLSPIAMPPSLWGGYSRYMYLHPHSIIHRVDDKTPAHLLAMAIPMSNGIQWTAYDADVRMGQTVLIQGPGQQGLAAVLTAKRLGARHIIVSGLARDTERLALAKRFGADDTINVDEEDLIERVYEITAGRGVDAALDLADGPRTLVDAIRCVTKTGMVVFAGARKIETFPADEMNAKRVTLRAARGHSYQAVDAAIEMISSGDYPVEAMATHRFSLAEVDKAIRSIGGAGEGGAIHISIIPSQSV